MLYNTAWEKPADVFSLDSLIAWLETMPADGAYCYSRAGHCLIAQYLVSMGCTNVSIGPGTYRCDPAPHDCKPLPRHWETIAIGYHRNWGETFGAALTRARKAAQAS